MERLRQRDATQVMAITLDWSKLLGWTPPFLSVLAAETQSSGPAKPKRTKDGLTREKLLAVDPSERHGFIEKLLDRTDSRDTQRLGFRSRRSSTADQTGNLLLDGGRIEEPGRDRSGDEAANHGAAARVLASLNAVPVDQPAGRNGALDIGRTIGRDCVGSGRPPLIDRRSPEQSLATVDELPDEAVDPLLRDLTAEGVDTAQEIGGVHRISSIGKYISDLSPLVKRARSDAAVTKEGRNTRRGLDELATTSRS